MAKLAAALLLAMSAAFALGYYSEQLPPALWRALVKILFTAVFYWGTAVMAKWLERQVQ